MTAPARLRAVSAALLGLVLLLALVWTDALPGGYRLRGLFAPHGVRAALEHAEHAARRRERFDRERAKAPAGTVVFLGSSTIERFPLEELFPRVACLDRGIGGEPLTELIDRLPSSLPAATPAGVVLYAGSVDLRLREREPERIAELCELALAWLRADLPGVPIALIGVLPERRPSARDRAGRERLHALLAETCARAGATFVPTDRPPITTADGALAEDLSVDRLHLNRDGYAVLADWLRADGGAVGRLLGGD